MADKQAVTELLNRAGVAYDTDDIDYLTRIFHPDGVFEIHITGNDPMSFEGRDTVRGLYEQSMKDQADHQRRHVIANICFENETETSITAISYLVLIKVENGQLDVISSGMYRDDLVLEGNEWLIRKRHLTLDLPY